MLIELELMVNKDYFSEDEIKAFQGDKDAYQKFRKGQWSFINIVPVHVLSQGIGELNPNNHK